MHKNTLSKQHRLIFLLFAVLISPVLAFADADKIFKEYSKAVVVVVAYNEKGEPISQGSGFIVRADGAIVTNYHVISNAKDIKVKVEDKVLDVEGLVHTDKENDLVILKVKGEKLQTVKIGDSEKATIGEKVYVISSPEGLENTISDGILSGIREITSDRKILQITAPISPGSSGGPVFNKDGEVIGIATLLIKEAQNLNFAMPVNLVTDSITSKKVIAVKESNIEDYKKSADYWFNIGLAYAELGMNKEVIESFKKVIQINPDNASAHNNLGIAYKESGMYKEAIDAYKKAIRIKPKNAYVHYNLGIAYDDLSMYKDAIESYKQASRIIPDYASAHTNLGNAYGRSGMYREAIESYKKVIQINPDNASAHDNLGNAYAELGMYKEAIESYKQAIRIIPDKASAHNNLGTTYDDLGMYKEAIESYKQAIRIKPDYVDAHYNLGIVYLRLRDRGSVLEEYKILKDLDSDTANELFNLIYK